MNRINRFLFGVAALALLAGCSDDIVNPDDNGGNGGGTDDGPGLYIGVDFSLPGAGQQTRSFTDGDDSSNDNEEEGKPFENNINEVLLILARPNDNGLIAYTVVPQQKITYTASTSTEVPAYYRATAKFAEDAFNKYYADASTNPGEGQSREVEVFVVCNPNKWILETLAGLDYGDTTWTDAYGEVSVDGQQSEGIIWSNGNGGNFLMSNSRIAKRLIPASLATWDNYTTEDKCFHLSDTNGAGDNVIDNSTTVNRGAINVQRAAARFDFKDGSPETTDANTYDVVFLKDNDDNITTTPLVSVTLNKMALVNMPKAYYYFKRVSADGTNSGSQLCGAEKAWFSDQNGTLIEGSGNYVVSYYNGRDGYNIPLMTNFGTYFNYPFFNNDGSIDNTNIQNTSDRWGTVRISDVLTNYPKDANNEYTVWRYGTENALPKGPEADPSKNQVNGNSTGIVFKAKIKGNAALLSDDNVSDDIKDLVRTLNNKVEGNGVMTQPLGNTNTDPILYSYNGLFYVTWPNVVKAAIAASFSYHYTSGGTVVQDWNRDNSFYKAVFGTGGVGTFKYKINGVETELTDNMALDSNAPNTIWNAWDKAGRPATGTEHDAFKGAMTKAGFTLYQSSNDADDGWGYYCYYYYWNRHNDNGNNGLMGPMEFAVVRNNVYKLSVTAINAVGHPRISENDPDKPTPDTPDEKTKRYLTVKCRVLPWVVRKNNIVFN